MDDLKKEAWWKLRTGKRKPSKFEIVGELLLGIFFLFTALTQSASLGVLIFNVALGLALLFKFIKDIHNRNKIEPND